MPPKKNLDNDNGDIEVTDDQPPGVTSVESDSESEEEFMVDANDGEVDTPNTSQVSTHKGKKPGRSVNGKKVKPKHPCPKCNENCTSGSIQCRVCDNWYHRKCADMTVKIFNMFNEAMAAGHDHCWSCTHCSTVFKKLNQKVTLLSKELELIKEQGTRTEGRVDKVEKRVDDMSKELKEVKNNTEGNSQVKNDIYIEINEREARRCNLLVHNISEPELIDPKDRKAHDSELVCEVFEYIGVNCQPTDFKFISRAGEKKPDKMRPVIIGFREYYLKERIMANAYRLKYNADMRDVRIVPDLTKRQRDDDTKVGREVDKRNEELERAGDRSHHWRMVGQRGARSMAKTTGERPLGPTIQVDNRNSRKRSLAGGSSGISPPRQRRALDN